MPYPKNVFASSECRIGFDPEVRYFENGSMVVNLSVSEYQGKNKQTDQPEYLNLRLSIWGKTAEFFLQENPQKGDRVAFTGALIDNSYPDKNTGQKVNAFAVRVDQISILKPLPNKDLSLDGVPF